jgi:hypothetical protein
MSSAGRRTRKPRSCSCSSTRPTSSISVEGHHGGESEAIIGTSLKRDDPAQLAENLRSTEITLDHEALDRLDRVSA